MSDLAAFVARLQRLEDIERITELFHRYRMLVDAKDFDAVGRLFAADARCLGRSGTTIGPTAISAMFRSHVGAAGLRANRGDDEHLFANPVIELDGDHAMVTIAWVHIVKSEHGTPLLLKVGHHEDVVAKVEGEWLFSEVRAVTNLFTGVS